MIEMKNVTKFYDNFRALNCIDLSVEKGEILGLLGPNGAGKTTAMRILTSFIPATSGTATVAGFDVFEDSLEVRRRLGYLPETPPLYPEMTVGSYLNFIGELRELPAKLRRTRIDYVADRIGLLESLPRVIGTLSKGYRQRVGLAQALLHNPEVLILDEPTVGLDPNQIIEIRGLVKDLAQDHTIVLSTHILPEVQATCTRVIIINKGKIVADGTPEELLSKSTAANRVHLQFAEHYDAIADNLRRVDFVDNVIKVEKAGERQPVYVVETKKDRDIRAKLFQLAVSKNWTLLEMHSETASLEDVFHQLTTN